jgi:lipopolysaccharide biosynthesis protein
MQRSIRNGDRVQVPREPASTGTRQTPVAVIAHVHYPEIWTEAAKLLSDRMTYPFRLLVTTSGSAADISVPRTSTLRDIQIIIVENQGRDILPFLRALRSWSDFDIGLKLHTKKSPQREDGDLWRSELLNGLLPADRTVSAIVERMRNDTRIGFVPPGGFALSVRPWIGINQPGLNEIMGALDLKDRDIDDAFFAAGSMFWFRREALAPLSDERVLSLFEPEAGQLDATIAHAMERAFPVAARGGGYVSLPLPALIRSRTTTSTKVLMKLARRHADCPSTYFPAPNVPALPPTAEGMRQARLIHKSFKRDGDLIARAKSMLRRLLGRRQVTPA